MTVCFHLSCSKKKLLYLYACLYFRHTELNHETSYHFGKQSKYFVLFSYTSPSPASITNKIPLQNIVFAIEVVVEWYSTQENAEGGVIGIEVYHLKAYICT